MTKLRLDGLDDLYAALRRLPKELTDEGGAIVLAHAEAAKSQIQAAYPEGRTGNLKGGVTVDRAASAFGARAIVRSRAKHAWLYENGSRARRTSRGVNRGTMPVGPDGHRFIPIAIKVRAQMIEALIAMVRRAGLQVAA